MRKNSKHAEPQRGHKVAAPDLIAPRGNLVWCDQIEGQEIEILSGLPLYKQPDQIRETEAHCDGSNGDSIVVN